MPLAWKEGRVIKVVHVKPDVLNGRCFYCDANILVNHPGCYKVILDTDGYESEYTRRARVFLLARRYSSIKEVYSDKDLKEHEGYILKDQHVIEEYIVENHLGVPYRVYDVTEDVVRSTTRVRDVFINHNLKCYPQTYNLGGEKCCECYVIENFEILDPNVIKNITKNYGGLRASRAMSPSHPFWRKFLRTILIDAAINRVILDGINSSLALELKKRVVAPMELFHCTVLDKNYMPPVQPPWLRMGKLTTSEIDARYIKRYREIIENTDGAEKSIQNKFTQTISQKLSETSNKEPIDVLFHKYEAKKATEILRMNSKFVSKTMTSEDYSKLENVTYKFELSLREHLPKNASIQRHIEYLTDEIFEYLYTYAHEYRSFEFY